MTDRPKICIIEKDLFVSEDMSRTVLAALPLAECLIFTNVAEARASVTHKREPQLVLVSAAANGTLPVSPDDVKWLVQRKVIVFDARACVSLPTWAYLEKPFAEEELVSAVLQLMSGEAGGEGAVSPQQPAI